MNIYHVYIITNYTKSTLYIGVTNDLSRRIEEHRNGLLKGFSKKYRLHYLVYFEEFDDINEAIEREKCLKKWKRAWKEELIKSVNPTWKDLGQDLG